MGRRAYPRDALGLPIPDGSWPPGREAPARLEIVRRFVNTQNMEAGSDVLRDPDELRRYLVTEGHGDPGEISPALFRRTTAVRAAVRALIESNGDAGRLPHAEAAFDIAVRPFPLRAHLQGGAGVVARGDGVAAFVARIIDATLASHLDGTWRRLRACAHCHWVIYDQSKNASGVWCSPLACGTRMKARAWRARQRG